MLTSRSRVHVPEAGTDWRREVGQRGERAVSLTLDGQLRQRAAGGPGDRHGATQHIELRLVAWTQERVPLLDVEPDRTTGVGAHLRVGNETVWRSAGLWFAELEHSGADVDQDRL